MVRRWCIWLISKKAFGRLLAEIKERSYKMKGVSEVIYSGL